MTSARRVTAVEASLSPGDVVLHVLAEAREFASIDAYARLIAEQPVDVAPITRIGRQTEASVRAAMKGKPSADVADAVRRAVGDGVFRFILFIEINRAAWRMAEIEGLRAAAMSFAMGSLLGGPREQDLAPEEWLVHREELAASWRKFRWIVANIRLKVMVEQDAYEQLEAKYLGGTSALFADAETDWDRLTDLVDRVSTLSDACWPDDPPIYDEEDAARRYDQRVAERARTIADDARVATFERLGELPRAVAIMERRLAL